MKFIISLMIGSYTTPEFFGVPVNYSGIDSFLELRTSSH